MSGLKAKVALVQKAIQHAEECPDSVKRMLGSTLALTVGTTKAERHPFNERFVAMIEEVLAHDQARLEKDLASKTAAFNEMSPAKETREAASEQAKAVAAEKSAALDALTQQVADADKAVKAATRDVKTAQKAQKAGDKTMDAITAKKDTLEATKNDSLAPIVAGTAEDKDQKAKTVLKVAASFDFDSSLLSTAEQVLAKDAAERGSFDTTCLEQLQEAFNTSIANFAGQLAELAPGKAERAGEVEKAEAAKTAAEAIEGDFKEKAAAAKQEKTDADAAADAAAKAVKSFMPELKAVGDVLDKARVELQSLKDGAAVAFAQLKEYKEGDFVKRKPYYEKIDGMLCDRAAIDACRESVVGQGDGRVSLDDAKKVFDALADGNRVTRAERWTLRYCLEEFNWTDAAHDWIVAELKTVPWEGASKRARTDGESYYEMVDGFKCDRGIINACRENVVGQGDGRVSLEDAHKVWEKAADGNQVTNTEKWTLRYCLSEFTWTSAGRDWLTNQLKTWTPAPAAGASA